MTSESKSDEARSFERQLNALRPLADFNVLLHTLRTYELATLPRDAEVFLSAGCAGNWYFEWIEQTYGRVKHHIGIEYFAPQPASLPLNVTWVANTVGNMSAVPDSSVDLVFSGQNIEHLWLKDVAGFLLESFRTLRPGGRLVIDSPNRLATRPLFWNHPQHTMEFTPDEIRTLLEMSGFDDITVRGICTVRDPVTLALLPLDAQTEVASWPLLRRVAAANLHPNHSFLWWAESRKSGPTPDSRALERFLTDLYRREWPIRLRQTSTQGLRALSGQVAASAQPGSYVLFGPYVPLPPGQHTVTFFVRKPDSDHGGGPVCTCDVYEGGRNLVASQVVGHPELSGEFRPISLAFKLSETTFGLEFRVRVDSATPVEVKTEIGFHSDCPYLSTS